MIILGVDPGSRHTGYGLVEIRGRVEHLVDAGTIHTAKGSMPERLLAIFEALSSIIQRWQPEAAAIETTFVNRVNAASALVLGQARGVALCALGRAGLMPAEYGPSQIKQAVTGSGRADKTQVQQMVRLLLKLEAAPSADAADALAVALTHARVSATAARSGLAIRGSFKDFRT